MQKTSNIRAREYVNSTQDFKGNNLFALWEGDFYTIYSYGFHFPLYVYQKSKNQWFKNVDKYSITTSRHFSQCKLEVNYLLSNTEALKNLISGKVLKYA